MCSGTSSVSAFAQLHWQPEDATEVMLRKHQHHHPLFVTYTHHSISQLTRWISITFRSFLSSGGQLIKVYRLKDGQSD